MPAPSEFKMGTQYHKVKRAEDEQEPTECERCALCDTTDVIDNGEFLDRESWVCDTCIEDEADSLEESDDQAAAERSD